MDEQERSGGNGGVPKAATELSDTAGVMKRLDTDTVMALKGKVI